ncbi:alpha/beta hydrolase [Actinocorallia sp. B10E7]|uniref:alpha/beta fold hydrolase n=1 Tax=Actinocorallia sp. B10E7 TaxID=3153558 RepID=UPI00325F058A
MNTSLDLTEPRPVHFTGADGITLAGEERGPADGSLVVMLHGGGQNRHSWRRAGQALARTGHRVVALDARGHGDSQWAGPGGYHPDLLIGDVTAVLDQLDRPAVLVGASMGGLIGIAAASHAGPEQVTSLLLVDVVPRIERQGSDRIFTFMSGHPEGFATLDEAADAVAAYLPSSGRGRNPDGLRRNLRQRPDGRWYWHWDPAFLTDVSNALDQRAADLEAAAARLRIPVLLLHGGRSDVVTADSVRAFAALLPTAQVVTLPQAAHTAAGDDNDAFTQAVLDFILT